MSTPNPNTWLLRMRRWHTWVGVSAAALLILSASTGLYLNHKDLFKRPDPRAPQPKPRESAPKSGHEFSKFIKDLHTGKVGGLAGKLIMDAAALALLFLSASGVYLWATILLRRRASRKPSPNPAGQVRDPGPLSPPLPRALYSTQKDLTCPPSGRSSGPPPAPSPSP